MVVVSTVILVVMFGCSAFQDGITPAYIEQDAAKYAGLIDITEFLPYTTLWDAKKLDRLMDHVHQTNQMDLARMLEDDNVKYGFLKDATVSHIQSAVAFQDTFFNPTGPIGMLVPALTAGTLGAFLISKPSDKKKIEELKNGNA